MQKNKYEEKIYPFLKTFKMSGIDPIIFQSEYNYDAFSSRSIALVYSLPWTISIGPKIFAR